MNCEIYFSITYYDTLFSLEIRILLPKFVFLCLNSYVEEECTCVLKLEVTKL